MNSYVKFYAATLILTLVVNISHAQNDYDKAIKIADRIIENTSFKIIDSESKELFDSTEGLPLEKKYKIESPYNMWHYWNGVLALAMVELSERTGDEKYREYTRKNYEFIFDNLNYFGKQFDAGIKDISIYQHFEMGLLDHCGAMSAGLCEVYKFDPKPEYETYLNKAINYVSNKELRFDDGTFIRRTPRKMTLWADDLYMCVPFLVRMAKRTGENKYFDDAILQVKNFNKYLVNKNNGLYYHGYFGDNGQNSVAHWGRCNGWIVMAETDLISQLPDSHPEKQNLIKILESHLISLSRFQDVSGMWHQIIDKPDSYLESSASAMFIYCIAKAVNEGWIKPTYSAIAFSGWSELSKNITDDGQVENICIGTGIRDNIQYYYSRETKLNDIHGLGAIILAGTEMKKLSENIKSLREKMLKE